MGGKDLGSIGGETLGFDGLKERIRVHWGKDLGSGLSGWIPDRPGPVSRDLLGAFWGSLGVPRERLWSFLGIW